MNAFQILDAKRQPIEINRLDEEVCAIVGVESDPKWYCRLGREEEYKSQMEYFSRASNWYDTIGWMIANDGKSFQDILDYYADGMKEFIGKVDEDGTTITLECIYPYHTKLINSWIEKGYTAKQIIQ